MVRAGTLVVREVRLDDNFKRDVRRLNKQQKSRLTIALRKLLIDASLPGLNLEKIGDALYSIRVDLAVRVTMTIEGDVATLRRYGNHEVYDRR